MVKVFGLYNRPKIKGIKFDDLSLTQQQYESECNINNIVDANMKFKDPSFLTKLMLSNRSNEPIYGDFTQIHDYQSALETVKLADNMFLSLPSKIRERFHNNPQHLVDFIDSCKNNIDNYNEGIKLGLFDNSMVSAPTVSNTVVESVSASSSETSAQDIT